MKPYPLFVLLLAACSEDPIPPTKLPPPQKIAAQPPASKAPTSKKLIEAPTSAPTTQEVEASIEALTTPCKEGSAKDCVSLGRQLWFVERFTESTDAYERACDAKSAEGCRRLAEHLIMGLGASVELTRASELLGASCQQKDGESCVLLADLIAQGRGATFDKERVQLLLMQGCELGSADACYRLALRADRGREAKSNPQQAKLWFEQACELGSGFACRKTANYHTEGRLTKQDPARANELLSRAIVIHGSACQGGSARDCISLGGLYMSGMGTQIDKERATSAYQTGANYYDAMCSAGALDSCVELIWLLSRSGPWALRDKKRAKALELQLVEKLPAPCEANDLEACYQLAVFYATGNGVDEDREKAKSLFQKLCDANINRGCSGVKRVERKEKLLREAAGEE